jgi:hypothetical protein
VLFETNAHFVLHILSSEIEKAFHQQLHFQNGLNRLIERSFLAVPNRHRSFDFNLPKRVSVCRNGLLGLGIHLSCRVQFRIEKHTF